MKEIELKIGQLHDFDNDINEFLADANIETDGVLYEFENRIEFYVDIFITENTSQDDLIKTLGINEDDLQEFEVDIMRNSLENGIRIQGIALKHALSTVYGVDVKSIPVTEEDIYIHYQ